MTRANARELAVHLIYGCSFTGDTPQEAIHIRLDKDYYTLLSAENDVYTERPSRAQCAYIDTLVSGVTSREEDLDQHIKKYAIGWDISRISRLARAILQVALFEILYMDDIPTNVSVSEAVRIAKLYDGDDTGAFVNGILGSFVRNLNVEV